MNPRIFGAFLVGIALVGGAYVWTTFGNTSAKQVAAVGDPGVEVVAGPAPVRSYISTNDQDNDGVPDWQEALRTAEPLLLSEIATGTYEFPDTVTDEFARTFFERVVRSQAYGPAGSTNDQIVETSIEQLAAEAVPEFIDFDAITVSSNNDNDAIFAYGNEIGAIINAYFNQSTDNEVEILLAMMRDGDQDRMNELVIIEENYEQIITQMKAIVVPSDLAIAHLNLINSLIAIHQNVEVFLQTYDDPMLAILHVQRYEDDIKGLGTSLENIIVEIVNREMYYEDQSYPGFVLMAFYPI